MAYPRPEHQRRYPVSVVPADEGLDGLYLDDVGELCTELTETDGVVLVTVAPLLRADPQGTPYTKEPSTSERAHDLVLEFDGSRFQLKPVRMSRLRRHESRPAPVSIPAKRDKPLAPVDAPLVVPATHAYQYDDDDENQSDADNVFDSSEESSEKVPEDDPDDEASSASD